MVRSMRLGAPTQQLARGQAAAAAPRLPFTIKDSFDTAGIVTTAGTVGWRDRVPDADATVVARLQGRGRDPASARRTRRSSPGRTRPTTTSTAGRRTRMTSRGRPAAAVAARRRSSPPAARRSTSAATPATASASRPTSAVSPGSSRRAGACRGPVTGRAFAGLFAGVHPARTDRPARRGPRADPADHRRARWRSTRTSYPVRCSAILDGRGRPGLRVATFTDNGVRTPTPETVDGRPRPRRLRCDAGAHASRSAGRPGWTRPAEAWDGDDLAPTATPGSSA